MRKITKLRCENELNIRIESIVYGFDERYGFKAIVNITHLAQGTYHRIFIKRNRRYFQSILSYVKKYERGYEI